MIDDLVYIIIERLRNLTCLYYYDMHVQDGSKDTDMKFIIVCKDRKARTDFTIWFYSDHLTVVDGDLYSVIAITRKYETIFRYSDLNIEDLCEFFINRLS